MKEFDLKDRAWMVENVFNHLLRPLSIFQIRGVFVRIKDKNLHVECFKCATCGTSLKNVGYYNINNKLYCDVHAKMVARQNPPGPGLEPVTVPFGKKPPANTISAALTTHTTAPKSPVSPTYQAPSSLPPYSPSSPALSGAKPYGTQNTIKSTSGSGAGGKGGSSGLTTAPRRGRGVLNPQNLAPGARVPLCGQCYQQIR
ncbi:PDZ and LIM domain protein Zasp-like isoform X1 [Diaphorina citri]|uniref:PDZ and LIM domain protein Zasp-like isoform X1 n=1 Tax=Diaphorina citri TaxID=121845 RepID=A0A3Q0J5P4_DIACI|nr:PDZ and LIM domain protein Zasp-like isoform X1 [Diaphorina citri]